MTQALFSRDSVPDNSRTINNAKQKAERKIVQSRSSQITLNTQHTAGFTEMHMEMLSNFSR